VSAALQGVLAVQGWVLGGWSLHLLGDGRLCYVHNLAGWREYRRGHPGRPRHAGPGLLPAQNRRREVEEGGATRPQAPHQRRRMASAPSRPRPPLTRPGRTTRADSSIQRGRHPEHWHFGASHSRTRPPRYARAQGAASPRPETPLTPRGFDPRGRRRHDPPQNEVSDRPYSVVRLRPHRTLRGQVENARGTGDLAQVDHRAGPPESVFCGPRPLYITRHRADARRLGARARLPEPHTHRLRIVSTERRGARPRQFWRVIGSV
jgi:hypothetical protein